MGFGYDVAMHHAAFAALVLLAGLAAPADRAPVFESKRFASVATFPTGWTLTSTSAANAEMVVAVRKAVGHPSVALECLELDREHTTKRAREVILGTFKDRKDFKLVSSRSATFAGRPSFELRLRYVDTNPVAPVETVVSGCMAGRRCYWLTCTAGVASYRGFEATFQAVRASVRIGKGR